MSIDELKSNFKHYDEEMETLATGYANFVIGQADYEEKRTGKKPLVFVEQLLEMDYAPDTHDSYDLEHKKVINEIEQVGFDIEKKNAQAKYLQAFIDDLEKRPNVLETYDEDIWSYLIDKAVVSRDGSINFNFRNGKKIKVD